MTEEIQPQSETVATADTQPARVEAPSTLRSSPDLVQVMVDQWGHRGEYVRGQIFRLDELDSAHYDHEHALRVGAIRRLTEAEARPESQPHTFALDVNREIDPDHARAMQFHAGILPDAPRTVTTAQGAAEPAEFAKPTLAGPDNTQEAARPVVVVDSALEAETEGSRASRVVPTSAGAVFERREDDQQSGGGRRSRARSSEEG